MSDSWEKDQPEHVQRTFKEIKELTKKTEALIKPGEPIKSIPSEPTKSIPIQPSPAATKYQEWRKIVEHKELEDIKN